MRKPSEDLVCARICLNMILIHFGFNDVVDSLLNEVNEGKITPVQAIEKGMDWSNAVQCKFYRPQSPSIKLSTTPRDNGR